MQTLLALAQQLPLRIYKNTESDQKTLYAALDGHIYLSRCINYHGPHPADYASYVLHPNNQTNPLSDLRSDDLSWRREKKELGLLLSNSVGIRIRYGL